MIVKALQQKLQQAEQQMQQMGMILKSRSDVEAVKSHTTLLRERMVQDGDAKEREITAQQKRHDTETFALTAQNVAEINGLVKLLTSKTEHGHRLREMVQQFQHDAALQDKQLEAKSNQDEAPETVQ